MRALLSTTNTRISLGASTIPRFILAAGAKGLDPNAHVNTKLESEKTLPDSAGANFGRVAICPVYGPRDLAIFWAGGQNLDMFWI